MRRILNELATSKLLVKSTNIAERLKNHPFSTMTLNDLNFVNRAIHELPIDEIQTNYVRKVPNACFALVTPTPLKNPKLIALSSSALKLFDLEISNEEASADSQFVNCFAGNELLNGSETASHCYCGHQFGVFAGQLGDGAAIYLGEVQNSKGEYWELQLKGAGKTPFSRDADGRKVLRSSIREFLCSEAMASLNIPTTRAGTCIVSDDTVIRDQFYDGHNKHERCTVILRIAQSFIRFGSFEIFKPMDNESQRVGPSFGRHDILKNLLDYCLRTLYTEIDEMKLEQNDKYKEFYREIVVRTAKMVAKWQCVGFVHGVLNTDNMSILGLTLDYGPFGFMDRFDIDHIPNTSDTDGRYSYRKQPEICFWNLLKFGEALNPIVPLTELKEILRNEYFKTYNQEYISIMNKKLGLQQILEKTIVQDSSSAEGTEKGAGKKSVVCDMDLLQVFFTVMSKFGSDFTNSFRILSKLDLPRLDSYQESREIVLNELIRQSSKKNEMLQKYETFMETPMIQMRMILLKNFAEQLKDDELSNRILAKLQHFEHIQEISNEQWIDECREEWSDFLDIYANRLEYDVQNVLDDSKLLSINEKRKQTMDSTNPRIILRNHLAEDAIKRAEKDDFEGVRELLAALERPFSNDEDLERFTLPPAPTCNLRVSCSS